MYCDNVMVRILSSDKYKYSLFEASEGDRPGLFSHSEEEARYNSDDVVILNFTSDF